MICIFENVFLHLICNFFERAESEIRTLFWARLEPADRYTRQGLGLLKDLDVIISHAEAFETALFDQSQIDKFDHKQDAGDQAAVFGAHSSDYKRQKHRPYRSTQSTNRNYDSSGPRPKPCSGCGRNNHGSEDRSKKCPAWGQDCRNCGMHNHFSNVCRQPKSSSSSSKVSGVNLIAHVVYDSKTKTFTSASKLKLDEVSATVIPLTTRGQLGPKPSMLSIFPDSGANICIAGIKHLQHLKIPLEKLTPCDTTRNQSDPIVRDYWSVKERLSSFKGVALLDNRIIVPKLLRKQVLEHLHSAHQGVTNMKARANQCVYWPGMDASIRNYRDTCLSPTCVKHRQSQQVEPLILTPIPEWPFQQICLDYFFIEHHAYLVIVDRYSGWLCIYHCQQGAATSANLINICRELFTVYGVPEEISSDGGPQFK